MMVVQTRTSISPRGEGEHDLLEGPLGHLPVSDADAGAGHEPLDRPPDAVDVLHAVVDEVDLPAAVQLAEDRRPDQAVVARDDLGVDRPAVHRRGLEAADVPQAEQGHVQRAGDRRRRQRQHVDRPPAWP